MRVFCVHAVLNRRIGGCKQESKVAYKIDDTSLTITVLFIATTATIFFNQNGFDATKHEAADRK